LFALNAANSLLVGVKEMSLLLIMMFLLIVMNAKKILRDIILAAHIMVDQFILVKAIVEINKKIGKIHIVSSL